MVIHKYFCCFQIVAVEIIHTSYYITSHMKLQNLLKLTLWEFVSSKLAKGRQKKELGYDGGGGVSALVAMVCYWLVPSKCNLISTSSQWLPQVNIPPSPLLLFWSTNAPPLLLLPQCVSSCCQYCCISPYN